MSEIRPLRAYAEVTLGRQRAPQHENGPHMVRYLRAANVKDGALDLGDVKAMNFEPGEQHIFSLKAGDVLVTEGSGSRSVVGASAVWNGALPGVVCFQNTLLRLRPRSSTDPRFLAWWCRYARNVGLFASIATGANIFHLSADRVRSLPMSYLPPADQRAIADFLDTETARIDALMDKKRRLAEALLDRFSEEVRRTALLNATYSNPLQLSSLDVPSSGVRAMRLSWIARFGSGTTPVAGAGHYYGGDIPWVLTGDLTDGEVLTTTRSVTDQALMDYSTLKVHPAESLVVAMYGATIGKLGILKVDAAVNQACCVISAGCNLDTEFLYFYLLGFRQELIDRGRGSGQPNISQEILRSLRIAIPSMDTQREVVASLKQKRARVWRLITAIDGQVRLLLERRQALITSAVTGELEIPGVAA